MKKNKILYLIIIMITIFSFTPSVKADEYKVKCDDLGNEEIGYENMWIGGEATSPYTGSCLYYHDIEPEVNMYNETYCHVVRLDLSLDGIQTSEYDPIKGEGSSQESYSKPALSDYSFKQSDNLNKEFVESTGGNCPISIKVERKVSSGTPTMPKEVIDTLVGDERKGEMYYLADVKGNNPITGKVLMKTDKIEFQFETLTIESCSDLLGEDLLEMLKTGFNVLKISIPLVVIALGIADFASAIFAGNEDKMKKSTIKFGKRLIIAIIIFLIPTILSLLLDIAHNIWGDRIGNDICDIVFK